MVFSDNFSNEILNGGASVQLIADGTDPNQASMITAYAANILATCQQEIAKKRNGRSGDHPGHQNALQSAGEERLQFRAWRHGPDADARSAR